MEGQSFSTPSSHVPISTLELHPLAGGWGTGISGEAWGWQAISPHSSPPPTPILSLSSLRSTRGSSRDFPPGASSPLRPVQQDPELGTGSSVLAHGHRNGPGWFPGTGGRLLGLSRAEMICPHLGDPVLMGTLTWMRNKPAPLGSCGLALVWGEEGGSWPWLPSQRKWLHGPLTHAGGEREGE